MAFTIRVTGVPAVNAELLEAAKRYTRKSHTRKILRPVAVDLRGKLREVVGRTFPQIKGGRRTGNLKKSIKTFSFPNTRNVHVGPRVGSGGADGYYFGWQDLGTSRGIRAKLMIERTIAQHGNALGNQIAIALYNDLKFFL